MKWILNTGMVLFLTSCFSGAKTPQALLEEVLSKRQNNTLSKEYMLDVTTGSLQQQIELMSEDDYSSYTSSLGITQGYYKILSENCESDTKCKVTYILTYKSTENDQKVFSSEIKKVASLEKVENDWKLVDMSNIKTFHEALEPINPLLDEEN